MEQVAMSIPEKSVACERAVPQSRYIAVQMTYDVVDDLERE